MAPRDVSQVSAWTGEGLTDKDDIQPRHSRSVSAEGGEAVGGGWWDLFQLGGITYDFAQPGAFDFDSIQRGLDALRDRPLHVHEAPTHTLLELPADYGREEGR